MDQILRPAEAAKYLGLKKSSLYAYAKKGLLPAPLKVGVKASGWRISTLDAYLNSQNETHGDQTPAKGD